MSTPLFSIITVTYNAEATIAPTVRSVAEQTETSYEHLVIDGASKDGTVDLAKRLGTERTHITSEPDHGIYDAMNRGLGLAKGSYVLFLNSGDTFHSADTLAHYARAIRENDMPGIVYGQTVLVAGGDRHVTGPRHLTAPSKLTLKSFSNGMVVCHQSMAVLRRIAEPYDLRYQLSADYEWAIRCLQHSRRNVYIDEVVTDYLEEGMTTRHLKASLRERFGIMCRYYGTAATIYRHFRFAARGLKRKLTTNSKQ